MKTIHVHLSIGFPTACHDDELEVPDEANQEEINEMVSDWAHNYIEYSWREDKSAKETGNE